MYLHAASFDNYYTYNEWAHVDTLMTIRCTLGYAKAGITCDFCQEHDHVGLLRPNVLYAKSRKQPVSEPIVIRFDWGKF